VRPPQAQQQRQAQQQQPQQPAVTQSDGAPAPFCVLSREYACLQPYLKDVGNASQWVIDGRTEGVPHAAAAASKFRSNPEAQRAAALLCQQLSNSAHGILLIEGRLQQLLTAPTEALHRWVRVFAADARLNASADRKAVTDKILSYLSCPDRELCWQQTVCNKMDEAMEQARRNLQQQQARRQQEQRQQEQRQQEQRQQEQQQWQWQTSSTALPGSEPAMAALLAMGAGAGAQWLLPPAGLASGLPPGMLSPAEWYEQQQLQQEQQQQQQL
jgi:hypothetical protein